MSSPFQFKYIHKLSGRRVLILGGTSGVGYAVAEALLEHSAHVIISGSNPTSVSRTLDRLRATPGGQGLSQNRGRGGGAATLSGKECDLSDPSTLEANLRELFLFATAEGTEKLDHVVFTAGDSLNNGPLSGVTPDDITKALVVRFTAPIMVAKLFPEFVNVSHESSLTLTGGSTSMRPVAGWVVAAGVGAGLEGAMRVMAVELAPVRVNLVALGAVRTELFGKMGDGFEEWLEKFRLEETLTKTIGKPEDAAEAYLYCMKDHLIDGTIVRTDGGRLLA